MAYCEVVTKIGNEFEKLDIAETAVFRGGGGGGPSPLLQPPHPPPSSLAGGPGAVVSGIVDDLIEDAVCASEGGGVRGGGRWPPSTDDRMCNVGGDVLRGVVGRADGPGGGSGGSLVMGGGVLGGGGSEEVEDDEAEKKVRCCMGVEEGRPGGVGDQLVGAAAGGGEEQQGRLLPVKETPSSTARHPVVEKKSRLTDLVKNSKQVLSKFILNETLKVKHDEWEEKTEKEVASVDLETARDSCDRYRAARGVGVGVGVGIRTVQEVDETPAAVAAAAEEVAMETVPLAALEAAAEAARKTKTFPACASGSRGLRGRFSTMRLHTGSGSGGGGAGGGLGELRKKKWALGSRIINYIRKRSTRARRETQEKEGH